MCVFVFFFYFRHMFRLESNAFSRTDQCSAILFFMSAYFMGKKKTKTQNSYTIQINKMRIPFLFFLAVVTNERFSNVFAEHESTLNGPIRAAYACVS